MCHTFSPSRYPLGFNGFSNRVRRFVMNDCSFLTRKQIGNPNMSTNQFIVTLLVRITFLIFIYLSYGFIFNSLKKNSGPFSCQKKLSNDGMHTCYVNLNRVLKKKNNRCGRLYFYRWPSSLFLFLNSQFAFNQPYQI